MTQIVVPWRDRSPIAGTFGKAWPKLKLSPTEQQMWDDTRAAMLWAFPMFSDVWYAMMVDRDGKQAWFTDQIPVAATDDKFMYINPKTFFSKDLTIDNRIFACCHEISHCIFNHCGLFWSIKQVGVIRYSDGKVLPYIDNLMQIAADCVINAMLVDAKIAGLHENWWHKPDLIPGSMSVLDAYRKLYENGKGGRQPKGCFPMPINGNGKDGKGFDHHLEPGQGRGKSATEAVSERNPQEWTNAVNAAMESARLMGRLPANLERQFIANMKVTTDWRELMALDVAKKLGQDGHSWTHLNQELMLRGIGFPAKLRYGCRKLVMVEDTSGSINQTTVNYFNSHVSHIIENCKPETLILAEVDATIHSWKQIEDIADLDGKVRGGGGTSFIPPFQRIEEEGDEPDLLIYLTDLEGSFPDHPPSYPVIWACINDHVAPWGTTIKIPMQVEDDLSEVA